MSDRLNVDPRRPLADGPSKVPRIQLIRTFQRRREGPESTFFRLGYVNMFFQHLERG
ncbi:MAG: hypothetical protein QOD00_2931 [Blastocatellia bacterium]|jgi:hypothetical protein|nr:hypothetical protein [Blastocatellia bacterium]